MRSRRRPALVLAPVATAALALALLGPAPATSASAPPPDAYGSVRNILPPGSNGTATAADVAAVGPDMQADATTPPHFADQLETYDALTTVEPDALTSADVDRFFKDASFTPDTVVSTETPRAGVSIERDSFGVPYVHGVTDDDVEFGAGYAGTQDRMFLMDVLRHTGQARLAEFAGDTPGNVAMDRAQLRLAYYTPQEATAQIDRAARRAGAEGPAFLSRVDSYLAGINAAQDAMCPVVSAPSCPAEYAALQKLPEDWTRADVVYVASLVGGIFGKGGGGEVANAVWFQRLVARYGQKRALRIYDDLREKNDPEAPTTSTRPAPYQRGGLRPGKPGVALPDVDGPIGSGTGDEVGAGGAGAAGPALSGHAVTPTIQAPGLAIEMPLHEHGTSNALLVGASRTDTGHPVAVMGPQTGYFAPQLLVEQVLDGPHIQARGVSFAGTNLVVQLGRGVDYAWSATSAGSDNVDTIVSRLCNRDGSRPDVTSTGYRVGSRCVAMYRATHTETTTPGPGSTAPPHTYRMQVLRTRDGIVQFRTTVLGKPVAIVSQRSTYGHEVDSVIGFAHFNDPGYTHDAASFQRAAGGIDYTFNWFYADDRDISFYSSGLLPRRSVRTDVDLPRWSGRRFANRGTLGFAAHPRETNPSRGYLVSWNNKPAPGFSAADDNWSYGPVYRSLALEDRLRADLRAGKVSATDLVGVMSDAATADSRAAATLPLLLKVIGRSPSQADALRRLRAWAADGAPRVDRDRDGSYSHQQAIAIFDSWWQHGRRSVAYDVLRGGLNKRLVHQLPQKIDDHPRQGIGSSFNGVAWYGYLDKDLRAALGRPVRGGYSRSYCGGGGLGQCRVALRKSLAGAVSSVERKQGVSSVGGLRYDKHQDDIRSVAAGVIGVRPIDWQNRPTFQQVVELTSHRPR